MSRYTGPTCKNCRRYGMKMCNKPAGKCGWEKRPTPPGEIGARARRRHSEYGSQLREKQKILAIYGLRERQFRRYYKEASRRTGITGELLLQILEHRLDNVVYRLGFTNTRPQARQAVNHGHIKVNGKKVDIPSYLTKPGQTISWRKASEEKNGLYEFAKARLKDVDVPKWLRLNQKDVEGSVFSEPILSDKELGIDTRLVVEYYSRR